MSLPLLPAKDPYEVVPYSADFTSLLETGDTIVSAQVIASPSGLSVGVPIIVSGVVTAFISGGTLGTAYELSFEIVTNYGWSVKRSGTLPVKDR